MSHDSQVDSSRVKLHIIWDDSVLLTCILSLELLPNSDWVKLTPKCLKSNNEKRYENELKKKESIAYLMFD